MRRRLHRDLPIPRFAGRSLRFDDGADFPATSPDSHENKCGCPPHGRGAIVRRSVGATWSGFLRQVIVVHLSGCLSANSRNHVPPADRTAQIPAPQKTRRAFRTTQAPIYGLVAVEAASPELSGTTQNSVDDFAREIKVKARSAALRREHLHRNLRSHVLNTLFGQMVPSPLQCTL